METTPRRRVLLAGILVVAVVTAAGCGDDDASVRQFKENQQDVPDTRVGMERGVVLRYEGDLPGPGGFPEVEVDVSDADEAVREEIVNRRVTVDCGVLSATMPWPSPDEDTAVFVLESGAENLGDVPATAENCELRAGGERLFRTYMKPQ